MKKSPYPTLDLFSNSDNKNNCDYIDSKASLQQAKYGPQANQWISLIIDAETSQVMKESEEKKISRNLFH